ncbi:MAG: AMP-binding protein, partial [Alphaproteobacteria bacterium]|nr:AMP-binding protein [Alphaproteobacteria bacterium]
MQDHTVAVDTAQTPTGLAFADVFNVAVPFVDRHIREGRGARVAIRDAAGAVTYADLAANVNRAGNALAGLGLRPGDRVLMVVKDCPLFF